VIETADAAGLLRRHHCPPPKRRRHRRPDGDDTFDERSPSTTLVTFRSR
jgi:hypothetical protein